MFSQAISTFENEVNFLAGIQLPNSKNTNRENEVIKSLGLNRERWFLFEKLKF